VLSNHKESLARDDDMKRKTNRTIKLTSITKSLALLFQKIADDCASLDRAS